MEDYKVSQIEINDLKDHLLQQEEMNKELEIQIQKFESEEVERDSKFKKIEDSI